MATSHVDQPLAGLKVLALGGIGPVPFATMLLADLGAEVTNVKRGAATFEAEEESHAILFRGQESILRNLKDPEDVADLRERISASDVLIEGFRPGVAERLGLGPEEALSINPKLVYARMTGWGQTGPYAQRAGHDINYIAVAGALEPCAAQDGTPVFPMNMLGDFGGGSLYVVTGILAALLRAQTTGKGSVIDAAIVDGAASLTAMLHSIRAAGQWDGRRKNTLDGGAPFYQVYRTKDGKWLAVGAIEPKFYANLLDVLGLTEQLADQAQFDRSHWEENIRIFTKIFAEKTEAEWLKLFDGVDACVTEVVSPDDVLDHPHLKARGSYINNNGRTEPAPCPRFSEVPEAR
ncbi:CoA transferase [Corynebacterium poyangense]|uniref:CoA transferase n=1 Tax=Corynebacterium poyangense TaxID=2684405 RepID=A0A7H0SR92_9CORY|nr:CaiB/BaiF CoA-transferase family protein [Corynebacterium poyangense]QNQ91067.1 CoA transferase [Corynebacterium poyangense]